MGIPEQTVDRDAGLDDVPQNEAPPSPQRFDEFLQEFSEAVEMGARPNEPRYIAAWNVVSDAYSRLFDEQLGRWCRVCGCTETYACFVGCAWVHQADDPEEQDEVGDLCTVCLPMERERAARLTDTRVLGECEMHFLTDCRECAEADGILMERGLP